MRRIFVYIKFLMAFVMLFDSVSVLGRANNKKKKKRSRVALSSRLVRGKGKKNNIKSGELKFEKPGSIFKKIDKDLKNPPAQTPPQRSPVVPAPIQQPVVPTPIQPILPKPPLLPIQPIFPPIVTPTPAPKVEKTDPDAELKLVIKELKKKVASSKNTCGAYTTTMVNINKQLGLGVSLTSGIGLGLSGIATATSAISFHKTRQQDKNFAKLGELQDGISSLKNLKTIDVEIDDNDLTKITATKKELATDKILALEKARAEAEELRIKLEKADGEAKTAELALNTEPDSTDTEEQDIKADADLQKKLKDAQDALANLQNQQDEPVKEPTQIAKTQEEIEAKKADERANKLKLEAEKLAKDLQSLKDRLQGLKETSQTEDEALKKARTDFTNADNALKEFKKIDPQQMKDAEAEARDAKKVAEAKKREYENLIKKKSCTKDYADKCNEVYAYIASYGLNNRGPSDDILRDWNRKLGLGLSGGTVGWDQVRHKLQIEKQCCESGNLVHGTCKLVKFVSQQDKDSKKQEWLTAQGTAESKKNAYDNLIKQQQQEKIKEQELIKAKNIAYGRLKELQDSDKLKTDKLKADIAKLEKQIELDTKTVEAKKKEAEKARIEADKKLAAAKSAKELADKQAKEKALADAKKKKDGALAEAQKRVADAEQAIKNNIEKKKKKIADEKEADKKAKLAEAQRLADEAKATANNLSEQLKAKQEEIAQKEQEAKEQLELRALQEQESLLVAQKQQELLNSADTIKKNHKVSRGLDITTATLSAVSAVSSGVSMGFSIATIEAVKKALTQLKECKADIYQIKLLNGKYLALTAEE